MCYPEKCCFIVPLDLACLILGFSTFNLSLFSAAASMTFLFMDDETRYRYLQTYLHIHRTDTPHTIILCSVTLVALLWMAFSVMLVVGIRKNKSSLVLCYFSYSVVISILSILSALLVLLNNHWILALVLALSSLWNTHCAGVVHSTYDCMLRGVMLKFNRRLESDEAILIESTD